ncbi:hypothetical protein DSCO28_07930 [Desulfosarcina ovata subsp. sediminis]|uniref:Uncharacterized protein n=1 Tax=Desulfosarcina ovata subsp. sediminis TaxID=885957 RepID=A0A5K7ZJS7_9BACT|nr:hypothetical protein [Desulfosarcina ovata]BBO80227.1 hypothetical protein DSCO28_07930 [Desulfosarcina ovata subsp. sediminis]
MASEQALQRFGQKAGITWGEAFARNESKPCAVKGCPEHRYQISQYCRKHYNTSKRWGHPEGIPIHPWHYHQEIEEVSRIIKRNRDHIGIVDRRAFLRDAIRMGHEILREGRLETENTVPFPQYFDPLYEAEADPEEVLIRLAGIWLYTHRNIGPVAPCKDEKHQLYLLGNALIRFIPGAVPNNFKYHARREIGQYLYRGIGVLLVNITNTIEREIASRERTERIQGANLEVNY